MLLTLLLLSFILLLGVLVLTYLHLRVQWSLKRERQAAELSLNDKLITMLGTKSPLEYQSVQAMNSQALVSDEGYDPSDEAMIKRLEARDGRDNAASTEWDELDYDIADEFEEARREIAGY